MKYYVFTKWQKREERQEITIDSHGRLGMSTIIEDVNARIVLNSRGEETIEVDVVTTSSLGRASAPTACTLRR